MGGRKKTPDILGVVLSKGGGGDGKPPKRQDAKPPSRQDAMPSKINIKPFKLTSYIEADLNDEADMAVIRLKKRVGKINKSILVEEALRLCLADPVASGLEAALMERNRK